MKKPLYVLLLCLGSSACLGIVWEWRASLLRQASLRQRLESSRNLLAGSAKGLSAAQQDLEALETALDSNRHAADILAEEEKWTARLLGLVEELQRQRQTHPAPPRKPRAPNPKMGQFFAELLGDPEYRRLARIVYGKSLRPVWYDDPALSAEQKARGMDLEFELSCVRMERDQELRNLARDDREGRKRVSQEYMAREADLQRQLLEQGFDGRAKLQAMASDPLSGKRSMAEILVAQLERRLSYTENPLAASQSQQLRDGLAPLLGERVAERRFSTTPVADYLRMQVGPAQRDALEELIQEAEAYDKRQKLPRTP